MTARLRLHLPAAVPAARGQLAFDEPPAPVAVPCSEWPVPRRLRRPTVTVPGPDAWNDNDLEEPAIPPPYWECVGPRDWRPVQVVIRFGDSRGMPEPVFPLVRTRPLAPRNVLIERADGSADVVPVRSLRRNKPHRKEA